MHYIKEIFLGKPVDYIHSQYTRYGKGTFDGPALTLKKGSTLKAEGSIHYVNILGSIIAETGPQEFEVDGVITAKRELKVPIEARKKPSKGRVHTVEIKGSAPADALKMIYGDYPDAYILLELNAGSWKLKCKKKPPRPGGGLDIKFCSAIMETSALDRVMDEVLFDVKDKNFKEAVIKHKITIDELVGSEELKKDSARFRLEAKRKGKIKRTVTIDGKTTETTHDFIV